MHVRRRPRSGATDPDAGFGADRIGFARRIAVTVALAE